MLPRLKTPSGLMERLDRLGWVDGISFGAYGARIGIRVNDAAMLRRLPQHLPPRWKAAASPFVDYLYSLRVEKKGAQSGEHLLYVGPRLETRTSDLDQVLETLESCLHFTVALGARRRLFVHAGVVGWRGRAVVIPGRSRSGKTSLVEALVRAGATYYSDEFAVFDAAGRVHPYHRPLYIRNECGESWRRCRVEELGGRAGTKPLPVGLIVATKYHPGAQWRPRPISAGEALLRLLDNTVLARSQPRLALATLQQVVPGAVALKGKRGEARDVIQSLFDRLVEGPVGMPLSEPRRRSAGRPRPFVHASVLSRLTENLE
jgi:hypothetical protein